MGSKNQKLNIPKDLLIQFYIEEELTTKQVSNKLKELGIDASASSVRNYLDVYEIPKRSRSEVTKIQIKTAKELDYDGYMESRKRAGESISETMHKKGFDELSRLSKISRNTYYSNRTDEQAERDRELQIKRGELGRRARRNTGSFGETTSIAENKYFEYLKEIFGEDNVIHGYRDPRYSRYYDKYCYNCDFYIPSKDLFIEYNGFYTHGPSPYDKSNKQHQELLEHYKSRNIDMRTWYDYDVKKVNTAKRNNLNLLCIYPDGGMYYTSNGETITLASLADL